MTSHPVQQGNLEREPHNSASGRRFDRFGIEPRAVADDSLRGELPVHRG